jgi:uncharacterized protein YcbK (DUF882 family)
VGINRRSLLTGAAAALLVAGKGQAAVPAARVVNVVNAHTGERFHGLYYFNHAYFRGPLEAFSQVARDHHAGKAREMHPSCMDMIWVYQTILELQEVVLLSGYRTAQTNANLEGAARHSYHIWGMATDLAVPARFSVDKVGQAMRRIVGGGIGLYHAQDFIHLDVGPQRNWAK